MCGKDGDGEKHCLMCGAQSRPASLHLLSFFPHLQSLRKEALQSIGQGSCQESRSRFPRGLGGRRVDLARDCVLGIELFIDRQNERELRKEIACSWTEGFGGLGIGVWW